MKQRPGVKQIATVYSTYLGPCKNVSSGPWHFEVTQQHRVQHAKESCMPARRVMGNLHSISPDPPPRPVLTAL